MRERTLFRVVRVVPLHQLCHWLNDVSHRGHHQSQIQLEEKTIAVVPSTGAIRLLLRLL